MVFIEAAVTFAANGLITSGFTHIPSSSDIIINVSGIYEVIFFVTTQTASQFALFLDGLVLTDSNYGTGVGSTAGPGQIIFSANAGQVLTLRNHTSTGLTANLPVSVGGSRTTVNASITIIQL
jgi:hypothetical protein